MLQEEEKFLSEVFAQLTDDDDKLSEFTLQPQNRDTLSKTLTKFRIIPGLDIVMGSSDLQVRSKNKFSYLIEFSPSMAHEFVIQKAHRGTMKSFSLM